MIFGVDRSEGTATPIFFDLELETILEQGWVSSERDLKTFAYIGGQGEGEVREIVTRYLGATEPTGFDRREMFVDARDLPDTESLESRGDAKLQETKTDDSVSVTLNLKGAFQYRTDWDVGDIITVRNQDWGFRKNMRVVGVKLSEKGDSGLTSLEVELDKHIPTLKSRVRQEIERTDIASRRI